MLTAERSRIRRSSLTVTARPVRRTLPRVKPPEPIATRKLERPADAVPFAPHPYVDYARYLTAEGGIGIVYKDLDERLRFIFGRLFLWTGATGASAWFLSFHSPIHSLAINLAALAAAAVINWLIVRQPVQVYRTIEIRPDSLIVEGCDIFWLRYIETWPQFAPGEDETQVLTGIYGTRRVEYLKVRSFDEFDSTPTVLASHLQEAMKQLWSWPY